MADEFDFMKDLGFSSEDLKGKTKAEALSIIEKRQKTREKQFLKIPRKNCLKTPNRNLPICFMFM